MENEIFTKELRLITNPTVEFYIPSYQRGYRWDSNQVTDLLDDLFEFMKTGIGKSVSYTHLDVYKRQTNSLTVLRMHGGWQTKEYLWC